MIFGNVREKVVGSTFAKPKSSWFVLNSEKQGTLPGYIEPEPTNPYDPHAKKVMVITKEGPRRVGYLSADGPLYRKTKMFKKNRIEATIAVDAWSQKDLKKTYNDSYVVIVK